MRKIDLMIVGAQKAGTTSLIKYFLDHPDVLSHPQTEFAFFRSDMEYKEGYNHVFNRYFTKGNPSAKTILAKNVGIYSDVQAIERLHDHNPNCKLIYLMREPVSRAISSYNMEIFNGWLKKEFYDLEEIIKNEAHDDVMYRLFIRLGLYAEHLRNIYKFFPKENVKLFLFENFKENPKSVFQEICHWAEIDPNGTSDFHVSHNATFVAKSPRVSQILMKLRNNDNILKKAAKKILPYALFTRLGNFVINQNKSSKKPNPISDEMRDFLYDYFKPYNEELKELTKLNLDKWNK